MAINITIHPIKGLDGTAVRSATILPSGALQFDRQWAFVEADGRFVNGKNCPSIHGVRAAFDLDEMTVELNGTVLSLQKQTGDLVTWMSERLGQRVSLRSNEAGGFPDDTEATGPTFVSDGSLKAVATWFGRPLSEVRRRFRANVEFLDTDPFWEDRLYGAGFLVGDVRVHAVNPCQRCVVPARDPVTGETLVGFQNRFNQLRRDNLPDDAPADCFNHHYRLAVNTHIDASEAGKFIHIDMDVRFPA